MLEFMSYRTIHLLTFKVIKTEILFEIDCAYEFFLLRCEKERKSVMVSENRSHPNFSYGLTFIFINLPNEKFSLIKQCTVHFSSQYAFTYTSRMFNEVLQMCTKQEKTCQHYRLYRS